MAIVFHENLTFNSYTIINYEKTADKILEDTLTLKDLQYKKGCCGEMN